MTAIIESALDEYFAQNNLAGSLRNLVTLTGRHVEQMADPTCASSADPYAVEATAIASVIGNLAHIAAALDLDMGDLVERGREMFEND